MTGSQMSNEVLQAVKLTVNYANHICRFISVAKQQTTIQQRDGFDINTGSSDIFALVTDMKHNITHKMAII